MRVVPKMQEKKSKEEERKEEKEEGKMKDAFPAQFKVRE